MTDLSWSCLFLVWSSVRSDDIRILWLCVQAWHASKHLFWKHSCVHCMIGYCLWNSYSHPGGGTQIIFWQGLRPEVWNPYPYLRCFLPQKRLFLPIFRNFCEMGPSSKDSFWPKWDPCQRILGEKVTHLGSTSPYALTCEYPPRLPPVEELL